MSEATYLGNKGYTIYKECLEIKGKKFIKEKLTVKPYIPKSPVQPPSFVFILKVTISFIYQILSGGFGEPDGFRISDGDDIDISFKGKLRDYQEPIVEAYMNSTKNIWGGGLQSPLGYGKCHGIDTL